MSNQNDFKTVKMEGITAILIYEHNVLLLKRLNIPFIINKGIWSFVFGGRKKDETSIQNALREIKEETGLEKSSLKLLYGPKKVILFDRKKKTRWTNQMFIFQSKSENIKKNFENAAYRWASVSDIKNNVDYTNIYENEQAIIKLIQKFSNG